MYAGTNGSLRNKECSFLLLKPFWCTAITVTPHTIGSVLLHRYFNDYTCFTATELRCCVTAFRDKRRDFLAKSSCPGSKLEVNCRAVGDWSREWAGILLDSYRGAKLLTYVKGAVSENNGTIGWEITQ